MRAHHEGDSRDPAGPERLGPPNSLSRALGLLGDEWTLMLLRALAAGSTKYSDFRGRMPISDAVLSNRLDRLVAAGVCERHQYQAKPPRFEYLPTPMGSAVWPLLLAIWTWERRWVTTHSYSTPPITHLACGKEMSPRYCCGHCGTEAPHGSVHLQWGPAGGWLRSLPDSQTRRRSSRRITHGGDFYPETMTVFGNRWSAVIIAAAFGGIHRFRDFEAALQPPSMVLAERLSALCEHDILEQVQLEDRPDWSEYRFTRKGIDLFPVLAIVLDWAERWFVDDEGPVLIRTHSTCGERFRGVLVCDHCGEVVRGDAIDLSEV